MRNSTFPQYFYVVFVIIVASHQEARSADWPMWRKDAQRSAVSLDETLPEKLHLQWTRELGPQRPAWPEDYRLEFDGVYEPIVLGHTMFVGSTKTDSLFAIDTRTGEQKWRFFAEGPIRFAPIGLKNRVYFGSDDGCFYCLEAETGKVVWKYRAAPGTRKVIGNERLVSVWPIRGGPAHVNGKIYFTAGMWPFEGGFLHAVSVDGTETEPDVEITALPYDVMAQGYIAANNSHLIIPSGGASATHYDMSTGVFRKIPCGGHKGGTDCHFTVSGHWMFNGGRIYDLAENMLLPVSCFRPVTMGSQLLGYSGSASYSLGSIDLTASELQDATDRQGKPIKRRVYPQKWSLNTRLVSTTAVKIDTRPAAKSGVTLGATRKTGTAISLRAGNRLYGYLGKTLYAVDIPSGKSTAATISWAVSIPEEPGAMLAADDRLFVMTREGTIHCFGAEKMQRKDHVLTKGDIQGTPLADEAARLLRLSKVTEGYCLALGIGNGQLIDELVRQSDLRIVAVDPDEKKVEKLRQRFSAVGQYGTRVTALTGSTATLALPLYMANLIVSGDLEAAGLGKGQPQLDSLYAALRPYGGVACLELEDSEHSNLGKRAALLSNALLSRKEGYTLLTRSGALEGAASWTDEFADAGNTLMSKDKLIKAPLGVQWFGGASAHKSLHHDRHGWPPSPAVLEGRMYIQGPDKLTAVDVYTGRILWQTSLEAGIGFGRRSAWGGKGYNMVAATDGIYVACKNVCLIFDPVTGKKRTELTLPGAKGGFGRIRIWKDLLIVPVFNAMDTYGEVPVKIIAMDRHDGTVRWTHSSTQSFPVMAIGGDRVFVYEGMVRNLYIADHRRNPKKEPLNDGTPAYHIKAFSARTGKELWSIGTKRAFTWMAYSDKTDVLVVTNKYGVEAWRGRDGVRLWEKTAWGGGMAFHPENMVDKVILRSDRVIDQRGPAMAYDIITGQLVTCDHPVSGESIPWKFTKKGKSCNYAIASEHLITFRAATGAYTDVNTGETTHLEGFRSGCRNSLIPADGVLSAPNFANGCKCGYPVYTSLALVHRPDVDTWSYNTFKVPTTPLRRMGINFGAPGDRRAQGASLWLSSPRQTMYHYVSRKPRGGPPKPEFEVEVTPAATRQFFNHSSMIDGQGLKWVAASGLEGISTVTVPLNPTTSKSRTFTLRLYFIEPDPRQPGERVFDVLAARRTLLANFDIAKETGGRRRMIVKEFKNIVCVDALRLSFKATKGTPVLSGLEIVADK